MTKNIYIVLDKNINTNILNYNIYADEDRARREYIKRNILKIKNLLNDNIEDDEIYTELSISEFKKKEYVITKTYDIHYFIDNIFKDEKFLDSLYEICEDFDRELPVYLFNI